MMNPSTCLFDRCQYAKRNAQHHRDQHRRGSQQHSTGQKNIGTFMVTNLEVQADRTDFFPQLFPLRSDGTAIKTAARHNPTLFLINQGTIIEKWSAVDLDAALKTIASLPDQ